MLIHLTKEEIINTIDTVKSNTRIPENDLNEMAIPTYLHKNKLIQWLFWKRHAYIIQMAKLQTISSVLDFGCGIGVVLPTLDKHVKGKVYATDLYPQFATELAKRRNLKVTFCDALSLNEQLEDNSIDLIIAADSMEHLEDVEPYLDLFMRKLSNGGRLILSGPTENWLYKIGRIVAGYRGADYHHSNIHILEKTIRSAGFKLLNKKNLPFSIPPHLFTILEFQKSNK